MSIVMTVSLLILAAGMIILVAARLLLTMRGRNEMAKPFIWVGLALSVGGVIGGIVGVIDSLF